MNAKYLKFALLLLIAGAAAGCGSTPTNVNVSGNNANAAANVAPAANNPLAFTTPTPAQTVNDAPTLGPVIQAYYEALKAKNDAAARSTMSAAFIKKTEDDLRAEKRSDLAVFLAETDTIPEQKLEVRNEKISGDKGVAEVRGGAYRNWTAFAFVREGGAWKLTGGSPELDSVSQQAR